MFALLEILCVCSYAVMDGIMNAIAFGKGNKDLKDLWHLAKHFSRICLVGLGYLIAGEMLLKSALIITISAIVGKLLIWKKINRYRPYWAAMDEKVKITTGSKFLDNFLGFDK